LLREDASGPLGGKVAEGDGENDARNHERYSFWTLQRGERLRDSWEAGGIPRVVLTFCVPVGVLRWLFRLRA